MTIPDEFSNAEATWSRDAYGFVQMLARELLEGRVQLPGFPEVAMGVQRVLNNERADVQDIVRAVSAEPVLAMQIVRIANSAAFNTTAQQVSDLRAAVSRIGSRMVRAAALAFAVQQLRNVEDLRLVRDRMNTLWRRAVVVASLSKAVAMRVPSVAPDAALLVGLLHVVGRLYVLSRLNQLPNVLNRDGVVEQIMDELGDSACRALLDSWEMPGEICAALATPINPDRELSYPVDLVGILTAAHVLADLMPPSRADYLDQMQLANVYLQTERLWKYLGLSRENCSDALHEALQDVQQMRALFGA